MRFHVIGVGSIGTLLSFHLRRTSRQLASDPDFVQNLPHKSSIPYLPTPLDLGVILRLRRTNLVRGTAKSVDNSISVRRNNVKEKEAGFGVEVQGSLEDLGGVFAGPKPSSRSPRMIHTPKLGTSRLEELGYPKGSIDSLIVTTKAQHTLIALRPLLPFITPATTIVLLQNGQGVLDLLIEQLFPDPNSRPHFILASTTHGAWMMNRLQCVHAAYGKLDFGIVPNRTLGRGFERMLKTSEVVQEDEERRKMGSSVVGEVDRGIDGRNGDGVESAMGDGQSHQPRPSLPSSTPIRPAPTLDISAIPNTPATQTLINTTSMLLNLPLAVTWQPIRKLQMLALQKLVVNACINPITALADCRNGDLFGNRHAIAAIRDVCHEVSAVLEALAIKAHRRKQTGKEQQEGSEDDVVLDWESMNRSDFLISPIIEGNPSGVPVLDSSLRPGALFNEVQRVIRLTGPNYSSMYQDVHKSATSTEIDFINGYFSKLGKSLGVDTPINDQLANLIQVKTSRTSGSWTAKRL